MVMLFSEYSGMSFGSLDQRKVVLSWLKRIESEMPYEQLSDKQTEIVAYRGALWNQKKS